MYFKDFIYEHFGTIQIFSEFMEVHRDTGSKMFRNPGAEITIRDIIKLSEKTGTPVTEIFESILKTIKLQDYEQQA